MLFLPEIRLKKICDALFKYLIEDLKSHIADNKENESYLYLLFHENEKDTNISVNYNQAKELFLRKDDNPRKLFISPVFDRRRAQMPTIHIVIPQDSESLNQIGDIEGEIYEEILNEKLERGFQTQFSLITTSDNITEALILNYTLRALLIGSTPHLSLVGFVNPSFSVQDLTLRPDLMPSNAYVKGLLMIATYLETFPEVGKVDGVTKVVFDINEIKY